MEYDEEEMFEEIEIVSNASNRIRIKDIVRHLDLSGLTLEERKEFIEWLIAKEKGLISEEWSKGSQST